jgi:protein TonB
MEFARSSAVVVATLLLHAGLLTAVIRGMAGHPPAPVTLPPLTVALLPPPQPAPEKKPPAPPRAAPAVKPPPEKKPPRQKPAPAPKAAPLPAPEREPAAVTPRRQATTESAAPTASASPADAASSASAAPAPAASPPPAPVKTGVSIPASYAARNRIPRQPPLSRKLGEQGTVILRVLVKADGTAGAVDVKTSSGFPLLDAAAKGAVESWRFNPATTDGKPVAEWHLVPIVFTLKD